jgi:hypothetical protein
MQDGLRPCLQPGNERARKRAIEAR